MKTIIIVYICNCHKDQMYLADVEGKYSITINKYLGGGIENMWGTITTGTEVVADYNDIYLEIKNMHSLFIALTR